MVYLPGNVAIWLKKGIAEVMHEIKNYAQIKYKTIPSISPTVS